MFEFALVPGTNPSKTQARRCALGNVASRHSFSVRKTLYYVGILSETIGYCMTNHIIGHMASLANDGRQDIVYSDVALRFAI